ncbi:MAG: dihydropteroate synthase [Rikenellaceae bacterium]|nr:dihydropteroate synthase [Rikenellaceae bacterium]
MAIVNVTPDSFWEGSRRGSDSGRIAEAVDRAVSEGAAILDVGGYSSRPGAADVPPQQEFERLARAMDIIRENHPQAVVSLDTFRARVAARIMERYGPCIVNDISAGELDPEMVPAAANLGVPYIAMHMRGNPQNMQDRTGYRDIVTEVTQYLSEKAEVLHSAGIGEIVLDPGFGFAKTARENHTLLHGLDRITAIGYPVLSGISRKAMIYKPLGTSPAEALAGTIALDWELLRKGAAILRVHDVKEAVETVKLFNYYIESSKFGNGKND